MDTQLLLKTAMLAGEIMLRSGAETYRVEDTMHHILKTADHIEMAEVLVIMTGISATIKLENEKAVTVTKRVEERDTNLKLVVDVNEISRQYCGDDLTLEQAYEKLSTLKQFEFSRKTTNLAMMGVGVGFTIFFGGSIADTGAAIIVGLFLVAFVSAGQDLKFHPFIQDIFAGFGVAFACCLLKEGLGDQMNMDTVMIGSFMPLVPGMAITNAVRDTLRGDYLSGGARVMEAFLKALGIAIGIGIGLALCAKIAVLLQVPRLFVLQAGIVGAIGGFVYLLAIHFGRGDMMASLYSAVAAAVVSHIFARVYKTPVTLFLIAGVLPTVPGNGMYQTVHYLIDGNEAMSEFYLIQTLEIAGVISLAIFVVDTFFQAFQKSEWKQNSMKYVRKIVPGAEEPQNTEKREK